MTCSYTFLKFSIPDPSSQYHTNDHMNKTEHTAMNCETYICVHTHCVETWSHFFVALCHNFWLTRKGCASFCAVFSNRFSVYNSTLSPPLQSSFSPWVYCHTLILSLAHKSLITPLIIFFSCSYSCSLHSQYHLKTNFYFTWEIYIDLINSLTLNHIWPSTLNQ